MGKFRTLRGGTPTCFWCDGEMLQEDLDVYRCVACGWVFYRQRARNPVCPVHHRRMERVGRGLCCPQGCLHLLEEQSAAEVEGSGPGEQDEDQDEEDHWSAWDAQQEWAAQRIKRWGRSRRRGRFRGPAQQKFDQWLRTRTRPEV